MKQKYEVIQQENQALNKAAQQYESQQIQKGPSISKRDN